MIVRLCPLSTVLAVLLLSVAAAPGGVFSDPFTGGVDGGVWSTIEATTNLYSVDDSNNDVRFAWVGPNNTHGLESVGLELDMSAIGGSQAGDFDVSVYFSDAQVARTTGLNQVELHTFYGNSSIFFVVRDDDQLNTAHVWADDGLHNYKPATNSGTLRVTRVGDTVSGYYNSTFIFADSISAPLTGIAFTLQNNLDSTDATSVTFDNFEISGPTVVPEPGTVAFGMLALAALGARRRRRG